VCHGFLLNNKRAPNRHPDISATLAGVSEKGLRFDTIDTNGRERLAMALFAAIPFSALVFENKNFPALALGHDLAMDRYPVYTGLADLDILAIRKYKDVVESDRRPDVAGDLLKPEDITFRNLILFTACGNHCIHVSALL
jgi:hypothetical protein